MGGCLERSRESDRLLSLEVFVGLNVSAFISTLPTGTQRVRVRSPQGLILYRKLSELDEDDEPVLSSGGKPVVIKGVLGSKKSTTTPVVPPPIPPQPIVIPAGVPPTVNTSTALSIITGQPPSSVLMTKEDFENAQVAEIRTVRRKRHGTNSLIKEVRKNSGGDAVYDAVLTSLSEEAELIEFERDRLVQNNQPTGHITEQRLRVLKAIADAWLKRRQKSSSGVEVDSPAFEVVFGFILETFRASMEDAGVRPEFIETIFAKLSKRLTDAWKEEARLRIKEKGIAT